MAPRHAHSLARQASQHLKKYSIIHYGSSLKAKCRELAARRDARTAAAASQSQQVGWQRVARGTHSARAEQAAQLTSTTEAQPLLLSVVCHIIVVSSRNKTISSSFLLYSYTLLQYTIVSRMKQKLGEEGNFGRSIEESQQPVSWQLAYHQLLAA